MTRPVRLLEVEVQDEASDGREGETTGVSHCPRFESCQRCHSCPLLRLLESPASAER
jgi:hypothetical protein